MDIEMKHIAKNMPDKSMFGRSTRNDMFAVASILPISLVKATNTLANTYIQGISIRLLEPAPESRLKISIRFDNDVFSDIEIAYILGIINATVIGAL